MLASVWESSLAKFTCWDIFRESLAIISFPSFEAAPIWSMANCEPFTVCTSRVIFFRLSRINASISFVEAALRSVSLLTSSAATENPRPSSPARAASMEAFRARRFVWSAMSDITSTISRIFLRAFRDQSDPRNDLPHGRGTSEAFSTDFWARREIFDKVSAIASMEFRTRSVDAVPCSTA